MKRKRTMSGMIMNNMSLVYENVNRVESEGNENVNRKIIGENLFNSPED